MTSATPPSTTDTDYRVIRRLYLDDPGVIEIDYARKGSDEHTFRWSGGDIVAISGHVAPVFACMQNDGALPWKLEWIARNPVEELWYVRKVEDEH